MASDNNRLLNSKGKQIVYSVLLEIEKEAFRTQFLERTAEAMGVSRTTVPRIRREKSETGRLSSPMRAKSKPAIQVH